MLRSRATALTRPLWLRRGSHILKRSLNLAAEDVVSENSKDLEKEEFLQALKYRESVWEREKSLQEELRKEKEVSGREIRVELSIGKVVPALAGVHSPLDLIKHADSGLLDEALVAKVDGQILWDLTRPLEKDCKLKILRFDDEEGRLTFWHSTAHVLGQSLEQTLPGRVLLCDGPALKDEAVNAAGGFFYEMKLDNNVAVSEAEFKTLEKAMKKFVKRKYRFERMEVSREVAKDMFAFNPFKIDLLRRIPPSEPITLYRCGPFIDLCRGPHVPHTGLMKGVKLTRCGASHWEGWSALTETLTESELAPLGAKSSEQCSVLGIGEHGPAASGSHHTGEGLQNDRASKEMARGKHDVQAKGVEDRSLQKTVGLEGAITEAEVEDGEGKALLQRVYGVAFPSKERLEVWESLMEELRARDHRRIGRAQSLFMFHPLSPGSAFLLPHGARVYNRLLQFLRDEYRERGYEEVLTPQLYKKKLWEISGHLENYQENMYQVSPGMDGPQSCADHLRHSLRTVAQEEREKALSTAAEGSGSGGRQASAGRGPEGGQEEEEVFGLKPMNCPGHCLVFRESRTFSYKDLPVRMADFSALHRNEHSGALSGLTRVRRFHQDDAHIFCSPDQVQQEIKGCLDFIEKVYGIFGFQFELELSTRPEKFVGTEETWDNAEDQLRNALQDCGRQWAINEGDGAFYGPKIDVSVRDAVGRLHQCATVQLDFQLPERFSLSYKAANGEKKTPIMIHRAILGSVERFMAILIEHTAGKWPLWVSPRQVALIPITADNEEYCNNLSERLRKESIFTEVLSPSQTLNKRIRHAQLSAFNYILVTGKREEERGAVNVRCRERGEIGEESAEEFLKRVQEEVAQFK